MPDCAPRSCSCSYTSIVYSEIVTEYLEVDCTCARVLQTTTCLPQPLPREPDYLRLEKTLVSDSKPFVPNEPQRIFYARSFPKHVGEIFTCRYAQTLRLCSFQKSQAEWIHPRDPNNTHVAEEVQVEGLKRTRAGKDERLSGQSAVFLNSQLLHCLFYSRLHFRSVSSKFTMHHGAKAIGNALLNRVRQMFILKK